MSQVCYYTCNLVPPGFLERTGHLPRALLGCVANGDSGTNPAADPTILPHSNTCPYVVRTLAAAEEALHADENALLAVPSGCDAMRRAGDALKARFGDRVFPYFVPRTNDPGSVAALTRELDRLQAWLETWAANGGHGGAQMRADGGGFGAGEVPAAVGGIGDTALGTYAYPRPPRPGGVFVMGGPMSHPTLLAAVEALGVPVAGVETCRGPERGSLLTKLGRPGLSNRDIATGLLEYPACPRCSAGGRREFLRQRLRDSEASAVLYARLPFCDPGAYDAMAARALADEGGLSFLELEIDYPLEIDGRLRVRIEAFLETLTLTDPMLDDKDDLFGDDPPPLHGPAGGPVSDCVPQTPGQARGNGNKAGNGGSTLLAASLTRRVLAAKEASSNN